MSEKNETRKLLMKVKDILEWFDEHQPDILYKEPCQFQGDLEPDNLCGGYMENDTGAWICGNEDNCPLSLGKEGDIEAVLKEIDRALEIIEKEDFLINQHEEQQDAKHIYISERKK